VKSYPSDSSPTEVASKVGKVAPTAAKGSRYRRLTDPELTEFAVRYYKEPPSARRPLKVVGMQQSAHKNYPAEQTEKEDSRNAAGSEMSSTDQEKENSRNATRAHRWLKDAFARGLVKVVPTPRISLDQKLAERLRETFPVLYGARVVDLDHLSIIDQRELDDKVHLELGYESAEWVSEGTIIRNGNSLGLGSGRGVYNTIFFCQDRLALAARNVRMLSLTGLVYAKDHSGTAYRDLEADKHTAMMVQCFCHGDVTSRMVGHPVVYETPDAMERVRKTTHLGTRWKENKPDHALLGVGSMVPGHRLYDEAKGDRHEPTLQPIVAELRELIKISDSIEFPECPFYRAVADIANHLFCVRGHLWDQIDEAKRASLEAVVAQINSKLLTITPEQLRDIENVIVVAGTENKSIALRHLLYTEECNIRFLVTDSKCARKILAHSY
jgi:DNA-binding transcriptional regulator LsrR (DeoR family)